MRSLKYHLAKLSAETGLPITVCHYPPGSSKWNKNEHRLFSFISLNWSGQTLSDIRAIVELIAAAKTTTGLTVQCGYDPNWYPTGVKINARNYATIALRPHEWHGEWNYSIAAQIARSIPLRALTQKRLNEATVLLGQGAQLSN